MKRSVPTIALALVGALVTLALLSRGSDDPVRQSVKARVAGTEIAASIPAQATIKAPARVRTPATIDNSARINLPRLHLKAEIGTNLNEGPVWWPVTGRPGGGDTVAIAGHRTTHTRPFYWLERLRPGDPIYIRWQGHVHAYRVSGRRILSAKNLHIADARGHEVLLLTACTPRGSARQRIVVYAWPKTHKNTKH
jgi:LPXTG-site transpeptidase (sortase) family protein